MMSRARYTLCTLLLALASPPAVADEEDDYFNPRPKEGYKSVRISKDAVDPDIHSYEFEGEPMPFKDMAVMPEIPVDPIRIFAGGRTVFAGELILEEGVNVNPYLQCERPLYDQPSNHLLDLRVVDTTPLKPKRIFRESAVGFDLDWTPLHYAQVLDNSYPWCRYRCFAPRGLPSGALHYMEPAQEIAEVARWVKDHPDAAATIPFLSEDTTQFLGRRSVGGFFRDQSLPVTMFSKAIKGKDGNTIQINYWDRNSCRYDELTGEGGADGVFGPFDALEVTVFRPDGITSFVDHHLNGYLNGNFSEVWEASSYLSFGNKYSDKGQITDSSDRNIKFELKKTPVLDRLGYPRGEWEVEFERPRQDIEKFFEKEYRRVIREVRHTAGLNFNSVGPFYK